MTLFRSSLLALGIATAVLVLGPVPAQAARCGPHEEVVKYLAGAHQEVPVAVGLTEQGTLMEVFAAASGTWTVVLTNAQHVACIVAAGEAWSQVEPVNRPDA